MLASRIKSKACRTVAGVGTAAALLVSTSGTGLAQTETPYGRVMIGQSDLPVSAGGLATPSGQTGGLATGAVYNALAASSRTDAPSLTVRVQGQVQGQVGAPIRLAPAVPGGSVQVAPSPIPPSQIAPVPIAPIDADPVTPAPLAASGITVNPLAPPSADGQGVLGPTERPLPATLWQGTSGATVETLIQRIRPSTAPTLQDLAYRLLASPAHAVGRRDAR